MSGNGTTFELPLTRLGIDAALTVHVRVDRAIEPGR
jgi:hypothetical protein